MEKLHTGALPWLRRLPKRFQDEFEGMAEGANIPLQCVAEFAYIRSINSFRSDMAVAFFRDMRAFLLHA